MRFAARFSLRFLSFALIFAVLLPAFSSLASAQTAQTAPASLQNKPSQALYDAPSYVQPDLEQGVPQNMHTLVQSIFLEMLLAFGCQLSGIDLSSPGMPCLAPNPFTAKIGYAPSPTENGELQVGGLLGVVANGIGAMYTPTVTTSDYTRYLANSFGLVKQTLAAPPKDAFEGFSPLLGLWTASRNIAYFLLILAFVFIGIGVMMRIQLDPRTVMTIQNQIPRVIIAIILITFSYSIAAVMADLMWTSTYLMINVVQNATKTTVRECGNMEIPVSTYATNTILASPFSFVNRVFLVNDCDFLETGLFDLSRNVSNNITAFEKDIVMSVFGLDPKATCDWGPDTNNTRSIDPVNIAQAFSPIFQVVKNAGNVIANLGDFGDCIFYGPFSKVMDWFLSTAWQIAVFIALVITLGRIWFMLLKAYAYIFLYVIMGPIFIVINLLPKRPLGFERWLRVFFVNLAIFPVTVLMLLLSRAFMDMFGQKTDKIFVPPLIGNPNHNEFGALIGFAVLLTIPGMYSLLRDKMGLQDIKQTQLGAQTFGAGRSMASAPVKSAWKGLWRKDAQGRPMGSLAVRSRDLVRRISGVDREGRRKIPFFTKAALRQQAIDAVGPYADWQPMYRDLLLRDRYRRRAGNRVWNQDAWDAYLQDRNALYHNPDPRLHGQASGPPPGVTRTIPRGLGGTAGVAAARADIAARGAPPPAAPPPAAPPPAAPPPAAPPPAAPPPAAPPPAAPPPAAPPPAAPPAGT